jgi:hypothetical protein
MWKEKRLQLYAGYLFIYVTVNIMTFVVVISQQYYSFTGSRSEKAVVKELNTKHVPYTAVSYTDMEAKRGMHNGERDDSNISLVWQQSVCVRSSSFKNQLPAK